MENLGSAAVADRVVFPYVDIETHLLSNGYEAIYQKHMPRQNLKKIELPASDPSFWQEYAQHLPRRAKTRAAADVAAELERRGAAGVTPEIRSVLTKVIGLSRGYR